MSLHPGQPGYLESLPCWDGSPGGPIPTELPAGWLAGYLDAVKKIEAERVAEERLRHEAMIANTEVVTVTDDDWADYEHQRVEAFAAAATEFYREAHRDFIDERIAMLGQDGLGWNIEAIETEWKNYCAALIGRGWKGPPRP